MQQPFVTWRLTMNTAIHHEIEKAINNPKIQEIMKELSLYGLGISVPHAHDENGNLIPLEQGMASYEDDLQVSFRSVEDESNGNYLTVGWRWNNESGTPEPVQKCAAGKFE